MLASRTHWFRAIATFILLYLLSAGLVALILWRLPPRASLKQPAGMPPTRPCLALRTYVLCMQFQAAGCVKGIECGLSM